MVVGLSSDRYGMKQRIEDKGTTTSHIVARVLSRRIPKQTNDSTVTQEVSHRRVAHRGGNEYEDAGEED